MLKLLQGIADFIGMIGDFLASFLISILQLFGYIGQAVLTIGEIIVFIPEDLAVIALAFVSMAVVFLIVGR